MAVIKHKSQRVGVFIDTGNIYHTAKHLYGCKVNFGNVVEFAVAGRHLIRAIAYVISTESGEEQGFFEALAKRGIETKTKDLQVFYSGAKKGDWDVGLAVDAIRLSPKLDTVILVTGDGDYVPLVEYLKLNEGVQVEIISFGQSSSLKLKEAADDFTDLALHLEDTLIGYRRRPTHTTHYREQVQQKEQIPETKPPVHIVQKQPTPHVQVVPQPQAQSTKQTQKKPQPVKKAKRLV
jgi:uncharacterized LabA/DUF88 family protein